MNWTDTYRDRMNADNLAAQHPSVQAKAKEILETLKSAQKHLYWALDPDESADSQAYWARSLIESAHALLDQAHEYRQALALNPPPKIPEDNNESSLQSTR